METHESIIIEQVKARNLSAKKTLSKVIANDKQIAYNVRKMCNYNCPDDVKEGTQGTMAAHKSKKLNMERLRKTLVEMEGLLQSVTVSGGDILT